MSGRDLDHVLEKQRLAAGSLGFLVKARLGLHRKLLFNLKEQAFQLRGWTVQGGSRVVGFSYSRRSKLPCALCTVLFLFYLFVCFFNKDSNKHSNKLCRVQTEMTVDRVLAHGGHCITSTLCLSIVNRWVHSSIIPIKAELLTPKKKQIETTKQLVCGR